MANANTTTAAATVVEESTPVTQSNTLTFVLDTDKAKAIRSALGDRTYFTSDESATAVEKASKHLEEAGAKTDNFYGLSIILGEGLEEASSILVSTVGVRDKGDPSKSIPARNGYKAIVIFKQPTVAEFLNDESEAARAFVAKLIEREATDVAFSGIRAADTVSDLQTVLTGLPVTVAELVENSRATGAGDSSFDTMWKDFRMGFIKAKYPALYELLPQKNDVAKAIRSAAYAKANPATAPIEEKGLFAKIAEVMIKAAVTWKDDKGEIVGLDTTDLQSWIDNRDSTVIDFKAAPADFSKLAGLDFE